MVRMESPILVHMHKKSYYKTLSNITNINVEELTLAILIKKTIPLRVVIEVNTIWTAGHY